MRNLLLTLFLTALFTDYSVATIYIPTPIEDQVKDSYGVVRGVYQGQVYKKNSNGEVITEVSIALKESTGLKPGDIINKNNFKITFPGGHWQGIQHKISGSPNFSKDEDVILLIHRGANGFHLLNFGLGKYSLVKDSGKLYLSSAIFPNNSKISGIPLEEFQGILEEKFGQPLTEFKGEKYVYDPNISTTKKGSRSPASLDDSNEDESKNSNSVMFWLMIILSVLGTSSYKLFNRKG